MVPDHITKLLEATKRWLGTLKSHINIVNHTILVTVVITPVQVIIAHFTQTNTHTKSEPEDIKDPHDSDSPDSNLDSSSDSEWLSQTDGIIKVKLSSMKYAMNFPVTINKKQHHVSVWYRSNYFMYA